MKKKIIRILFIATIFNIVFFLPLLSASATQIPIQGKNYSSNIEPESIAYGQLENGTVYVPLRVLFEKYDAEVNWHPAKKAITIKRCDGAVITMTIGSKIAEIAQNNKNNNLIIDVAPKISDENTMVPLRFVAENLLCNVEWVGKEKKVIITKEYLTNTLNESQYTINLKTEDLYAKDGNNNFKLICRLENIRNYYSSIKPDYSTIKKVEQTPNGNYLITIDLDILDAKIMNQICAYVNVKQQSSLMGLLQQPIFGSVDYNYYFDKNGIWFPEEHQVRKINDVTAKIETSYNYRDVLEKSSKSKNYIALNDIEKIGFDYCDGNYMLLSYNKKSTFNTKYFVLVNLKSYEVTDIIGELIPSDDINDFIKKDYMSPANYLEFVKADNSKLYFNYIKHDDLLKPISNTISYQY